MKPIRLLAVVPLVFSVAFGFGCAESGRNNPSESGQGPTVVVSFTILKDLVAQVAGEDVIDIRLLAPPGAEVHEWELSPQNFIDLEHADLVFINGLDLEQWLPQLRASVGYDVPIVEVAEETGYPTHPIQVGDFEGAPDPHIWMDPRAAIEYVKVIRDRLEALDPEHGERYRKNAGKFVSKLEDLHEELREAFKTIPEADRILITSEAAFLYFADAYGFVHDGIWGSNAEEEGTPRQIARIIDIIHERSPAALFWESTITDRYVRSVSDETRTPVAGPLYVDSLAKPGAGPTTYIELMRENARVILSTFQNGQS